MEFLSSLEDDALAGETAEESHQNAVEQIRAHLEAGALDQAARVFDSLIGASFQLPYKDDQMQSWIRWATAANETDRAQTGARFQLIASCLPKLRDQTENSRHTTAVLLHRVAEWDVGAGCALLAWCLDQSLIDLVTGIAILCEEAAANPLLHSSPAVQSIVRHSVLPIGSETHGVDVVDALADAICQSAATSSTSTTMSRLEGLVRSVRVEALGSTRPRMLAAIESACREHQIALGPLGGAAPASVAAVMTRERFESSFDLPSSRSRRIVK